MASILIAWGYGDFVRAIYAFWAISPVVWS